jgi:hypothetical protein
MRKESERRKNAKRRPRFHREQGREVSEGEVMREREGKWSEGREHTVEV